MLTSYDKNMIELLAALHFPLFKDWVERFSPNDFNIFKDQTFFYNQLKCLKYPNDNFQIDEFSQFWEKGLLEMGFSIEESFLWKDCIEKKENYQKINFNLNSRQIFKFEDLVDPLFLKHICCFRVLENEASFFTTQISEELFTMFITKDEYFDPFTASKIVHEIQHIQDSYDGLELDLKKQEERAIERQILFLKEYGSLEDGNLLYQDLILNSLESLESDFLLFKRPSLRNCEIPIKIPFNGILYLNGYCEAVKKCADSSLVF